MNDLSLIEYVCHKDEYNVEKTLSIGEIFFVLKGSFELSYDHFFDRRINSGEILFIPPGCHFKAKVSNGMSGFVFRMKDELSIHENRAFHQLVNKMGDFSYDLHRLEIKFPLVAFLEDLKINIEYGLRSEAYLTLKCNELFFLLQSYYSSEKLAEFFYPILGKDPAFKHFILKNYRNVKTIKELAELYGYSVSHFDKKFKEVFNSSAYQWIQKQKVNLLYYEISRTDKPIRQIAQEQQFKSSTQFNDYCKKHFGYPPGKMRKLAKLFS